MPLGTTNDKLPTPDFRSLFESAPGLYLVLTPDLRIVTASDAYLAATMTTRQDIVGRGLFDVFPDNPNDPAATGVRNLADSLDRVKRFARADAMAVQKYDVRRPESEGGKFEERYWSPLNSPVIGAHGEVAYIIHRVEDVTEFIRLKQAGSEQERTTEALRNRSEQMESEVFLRAQEVSQANRELRTANEHLARLYDQIARLMTQAEKELRLDSGGDASVAAVETLTKPEDMLARVGRLITSYKLLNDQLRQAQKMEAVGRLAGGIAHDFNNLLTVIVGYAKLAQGNTDLKDEVRAKLADIQLAGERAALLTAQLLAFSRKQVTQHHLVPLNAFIGDLEDILRRLLTEDIELKFTFDPAGCFVNADAGQLTQLLMNLVANARDAMPTGGKLAVQTLTVLQQSEYADHDGVRPAGTYVLLRVTDTGAGMDAETRSHIFEPFFTTKEVGKGTGLGLATVKGIVLQHRGWIDLNSELGRGTTFNIYLPAASAAPEPEVQMTATPSSIQPATILLVEDQAAIRLFAEEVLEDGGHNVLTAGNGAAALRVAAKHDGVIDLLITDVVMPEMNGPMLATHLVEVRPNLKVLYVSGYTDAALVDRGVIPDHVALLQKPFLPDALLRKVNELLQSRASVALGKAQLS